jgi:hypothetical protein
VTRDLLYAARNLDLDADRLEREASVLRSKANHIRRVARNEDVREPQAVR